MLIYGIETTAPNRHDRKSVKRLVAESAFERHLRAEVREGVLSQTMKEAKQEAACWLATWKAEAEQAKTPEQQGSQQESVREGGS